MNLRIKHNLKTSKAFLIALYLHFPVFICLGLMNQSSWVSYLALPLFFLAVPTLLYLRDDQSLVLPNVMAFSLISFSGLLIHLGNGMIEMHFHIFIVIAAIGCYGLISTVLTTVLTAAVHHLLFFFILPASVFNYKASIWIVLLHAAFVVICAIPALYVAHLIKNMIFMQDTTVSSLEKVSETLIESSKAISSDSQTLQEQSNNSIHAVSSTSTAVEEITAMIKLNSENTVKASNLSEETYKKASHGQSEVQVLKKVMNSMSTSSLEMSSMMNLIEDISFQTNLLALNAAVEAARAGEQGKGFAVVADAVRSLAQKAAVSTKEIKSQIQNLLELIQQGQKSAGNSSDALGDIVISVNEVLNLNKNIAGASIEQSKNLDYINKQIYQVDRAAKDTAEASTGIAMSANHIDQYSLELEKLVQQLSNNEKAS